MCKLPRITGEEAIRAFGRVGFAEVRVRGSHHILKREDPPARLSIPVHRGKTLGLGLLKSLIDAAGLTVIEFIDLL